ncbi:hypothetical protein GN244_ATG07927 [Phytophthora infestans]|uniref:Uncharacterized protein n=1 Tax=Phytophthora infestans TaxID=4787 RepID=A0A833SYI2_PHYIN|nr:hypothetical protein GN244_ATG07927 [Phytophthora infestans]KAF4127418.1 hypothetical protein GN958_ATG23398 [Phytophthora infestans]
MRTSFAFDSDKQLVHLARTYNDKGSQISWHDVAHRMRSTGHTAAVLRQRLQSLFEHGTRTSPISMYHVRKSGENGHHRYPREFFHRGPCFPRERPPAVTHQLRDPRCEINSSTRDSRGCCSCSTPDWNSSIYVASFVSTDSAKFSFTHYGSSSSAQAATNHGDGPRCSLPTRRQVSSAHVSTGAVLYTDKDSESDNQSCESLEADVATSTTSQSSPPTPPLSPQSESGGVEFYGGSTRSDQAQR